MKRVITALFLAFGVFFLPFIALAQEPPKETLLYDGTLGTLPEHQNMTRATFPITASVVMTTATSVNVDTTADNATLSTYRALIPGLNHVAGYEIDLKISSEIRRNDGDNEGLSLIATSYSGFDYRSLYLVIWQDALIVNPYSDFEQLVAIPDTASKHYRITVDPFLDGSLLAYKLTIRVNGFVRYVGTIEDYSSSFPKNGYDHTINPFVWKGWIEIGDATNEASVDFDFEHMSIATNVLPTIPMRPKTTLYFSLVHR